MSRPVAPPHGARVRITAVPNFGLSGRIVRGSAPAPKGYVYVERDGDLDRRASAGNPSISAGTSWRDGAGRATRVDPNPTLRERVSRSIPVRNGDALRIQPFGRSFRIA